MKNYPWGYPPSPQEAPGDAPVLVCGVRSWMIVVRDSVGVCFLSWHNVSWESLLLCACVIDCDIGCTLESGHVDTVIIWEAALFVCEFLFVCMAGLEARCLIIEMRRKPRPSHDSALWLNKLYIHKDLPIGDFRMSAGRYWHHFSFHFSCT